MMMMMMIIIIIIIITITITIITYVISFPGSKISGKMFSYH